ncbi:hypothetical protein QTN25_005032 [Entamoeba marina]
MSVGTNSTKSKLNFSGTKKFVPRKKQPVSAVKQPVLDIKPPKGFPEDYLQAFLDADQKTREMYIQLFMGDIVEDDNSVVKEHEEAFEEYIEISEDEADVLEIDDVKIKNYVDKVKDKRPAEGALFLDDAKVISENIIKEEAMHLRAIGIVYISRVVKDQKDIKEYTSFISAYIQKEGIKWPR